MLYTVSKIEQSAHHVDELQNPKNPGNAMVLGVYRNKAQLPLCTLYSRKAFGEFWDNVEQQKIARRFWTPEMKGFAQQKIAAAPKPPFLFKFTILGWIFMLIIAAMFVMLVYDSVKPDTPKSAEYVAMEQVPVAGDVYFGRFEAFDTAGDRIASDMGFGWFKIVQVEDNVFHVVKSQEMSKQHKPKEKLNSVDFEEQGIPLHITEQHGYMINMKSTDGKMEIYITDKK